MPLLLTNNEYDSIMRSYQVLRLTSKNTLEQHKKEAYANIPMLQELDKEIADISFNCYRNKDKEAIKSLPEKINTISKKKEGLLKEYGYPSDFLTEKHFCEKCEDTGYIDNKRCDCFKKKIINLVYSEPRWKNTFSTDNFSNFNLDYYDNECIDKESNLSSKATAKKVLIECENFVRDILDNNNDGTLNMMLMGNTGVGKTFLCNSIAKDLIDAGKYVVYLTAPALIELFEKTSFSYNTSREFSPDTYDFSYKSLFDCDLLIIDDLGVESSNNYTKPRIFDLLNRRLTSACPTLISTNLDIQAINDTYTERLVSRIIGSYRVLKLFGEDIRIKKRFLSDEPA